MPCKCSNLNGKKPCLESDQQRALSGKQEAVSDMDSTPTFLSDLEIIPSQIEICRRANGDYWKLGAGSFGSVSQLNIALMRAL